MGIFLISGMSGSGKSVALKALEDAGYECIDNLPINLLAPLIDHLNPEINHKIAITIDSRRGTSIEDLPNIVEHIKGPIEIHTIFLNASTETLVKRFSETRRRHPLSLHTQENIAKSLEESIEQERILLAGISEYSLQIDTSNISSNTLRAWILELVNEKFAGLTLLLESFGFKNGVPNNADLVFDARCIPNPYYENALRPLTGNDEAVKQFLIEQPLYLKMFEDIKTYLENWIPHYQKDGRSYLSLAIGCTGGKHRSVALINLLYDQFKLHQVFPDLTVIRRHRDLILATTPSAKD